MNNLKSLRHVVALADAGNYRKAAAALGITHTALSQSVQRQEEAYGVQLFIRNRKTTVPTVFGRRIVEAARVAIDELEQAHHEVQLMRRMRLGHLVIGADPWVDEVFIAPSILPFMKEPTGLSFESVACGWSNAEEYLDAKKVDVYVGLMPNDKSARFEYREIRFMPPVIVARADHPLMSAPLPTIEAAFEYPIVATSVPDWVLLKFLEVKPELFGPLVDQNPLFFNTQNMSIARQLLLEGDALAILPPNYFREDIDAARLAVVRPLEWPFRSPLLGAIVTLAGRSLPTSAARFCEYIEENIRQMNAQIRSVYPASDFSA